jgi:methionyl-tRNA synthetase
MESSENTPPPPAAATPQEVPVQAPEYIDIDYFAKVDLRIAQILEVNSIPKSKKLYKLKVSLGDLGERQILSGIAHKFTPEELVGRKIVIIANLKPAKLMGEESQGMLLASSTEGDAILALLQPAIDIPAGTRVR